MSAPRWGHVAEWLRSGLQNRLHQFNSGRGLQPLYSRPRGFVPAAIVGIAFSCALGLNLL